MTIKSFGTLFILDLRKILFKYTKISNLILLNPFVEISNITF